eukprot:744392-Amphidinium_carterae.2
MGCAGVTVTVLKAPGGGVGPPGCPVVMFCGDHRAGEVTVLLPGGCCACVRHGLDVRLANIQL